MYMYVWVYSLYTVLNVDAFLRGVGGGDYRVKRGKLYSLTITIENAKSQIFRVRGTFHCSWRKSSPEFNPDYISLKKKKK